MNDSPEVAQDRLLAQAKRGCRASRALALDNCRDYLQWAARKELDDRLLRKCDASDIVQNTYVQAVESFNSFRGRTPESLRAWLRAILRREIATLRRSFLATQKRNAEREVRWSLESSIETPSQLVDQHPTPSCLSVAQERSLLLRQVLNSLTPDHRQVLLLRNWERLSFAEAASKMGRSEDAVKKLWGRALLQLRIALNHVQSESTWQD